MSPACRSSAWSENVADEFSAAAVLLAPCPVDSFGLGVVEAMAAGVPVVAWAAGGHLETVGLLPSAPLFPPGDALAAAAALRSLLPDEKRTMASQANRRLAARDFTLQRHAVLLLAQYELVADPPAR